MYVSSKIPYLTMEKSKSVTLISLLLQDPKAKKLHDASELIRQEFRKYFDLEIVFDEPESGLQKVKEALKELSAETQWVPRNWVYS